MESIVRHQYDDSLKLKAIGSVAITADETATLVDINRIVNGRGDVAGRYGEGSFDVVVHVLALDHTTGDETYAINFNTYDSAGSNATLQETVNFTTADVGKTKVFKFDTGTLRGVDSDAAKFGIAVDVGGTTPILQYYAYIAPNDRW